ncbi:ATP-binding protein [Aurantimonas marina]|uniref:ATP-binding protein n=1 Tax=Aurantimonas marina TaxID=2780508 RepID=UPI0019CFA324|nr:hybrid sensor histidine kinase/response regulator [Aurantimonas marina]
MAAAHRAPQALILAPRGRDASIAASLLKEVGLGARICADLDALTRDIGADTAFLVMTEEATRGADLRNLVGQLEAQSSWSDLACIVLTSRGGGPERNPAAARISEALGNVTFIERPFHPTTFTSAARTALKGRLRQFEARARLDELRESGERLTTALTAGRLGSWELDLKTSELIVSETCKANFGRGPEQSLSYGELLSSIHPDDRQRMREAVERSIADNTDYVIEYRVLWPDKSLHWLEVRARVVSDEAKGTSSLVGVSSDITDRKTSEENLRRLNETLEERVAERTAELKRTHELVLTEITQRERAEEQLRQAQKMEMIGQLTGGVAHDFNNLLMAVLGNLDLLRKHFAADAKAARLIDGALQGAMRGAALTQRLLAFARRQDLRVEATDLVTLVGGMTALLEKSVGPDIEMRFDPPDETFWTLIDPNQVELALLNLVVNARDAMPEGGIVSIGLDTPTPPSALNLGAGPYLRLSVTDTGQGMDAETVSRAIEPFFSTKELGKGTGLGLSMIHGLAVQLNGALRLESHVGRGTTAELWLPATTAVAHPEPVIADSNEILAGDAVPRSTILFVDDDFLIAMSTVDMLEDLGHEVIEANSGAAALEILRGPDPIDLMITDYSMPKMNGGQLTEEARRLRPDLPILLATGYAELPDNSTLDVPRLGKPYLQQQLAAEIAKLINVRHPGTADATASERV